MVTNQFVEPARIVLPNQFDNNAEILTADTGIVINSVIVCNTSGVQLRIKLFVVQHIGVLSPVKSHILYNVVVDVNESMNLLALKSSSGNPIGELFLKDGDSLVCNSSSTSQKFDLTAYYTILKEYDDLPL